MIYLSIDIEATGPFPGLYSMVSLGAVPLIYNADKEWVLNSEETFYEELQPLPDAATLPEAMAIHGLTLDHLAAQGSSPQETMVHWEQYLTRLKHKYDSELIGMAWPASFDLPYVGWYSQKFTNHNPLGWRSFDIQCYGMGVFQCSRNKLVRNLRKSGIKPNPNLKRHHALHDAIEQGETAMQLFNYSHYRPS